MGTRNEFVKVWNILMGSLLLVVAAGSLYFAWGALGNLFEDYQDSPAGTYLAVGLPFVAVGILAGVAGIAVIRLAFKDEN